MIIISDNDTYLFEKIAKKNGIDINQIINLAPECEKNIYKDSKEILILISSLIYKKFKLKNFEFDNFDNFFKNELEIINKLISNLSKNGFIIYFPFIPKHFIYSDKYYSSFYEKNSYDNYLENLNQKLYEKFNHFSNIIFLKGIEKLSPKISKVYYRFSSIYDEENSFKILSQYLVYRESLKIKKKKLIIFDLDNTIWKGIVGDDSINGVRMDLSDPIGTVFNNVQNILLKYKQNGFLLAVCSKNDQELALKCLFQHPASLFSKDDIVSYRINWEPKSQNIKEICKELNISVLDAIFVDDSDYECDEVRKNCEGISIFKVPKNIYNYPVELSSNSLFYLGSSNKEDRRRTDMYKDNQKRKEIYNEVIKEKGTKDKWIESLEIKLSINRITLNSSNKDRVIQLFNRTNQFNLTGDKFNTVLLNEKLVGDNLYFHGSVSDKIGSEGLVSVIGCKYDSKNLLIENYILSCRVFGRYIEELMLLPVLNYAISIKSDIYFKFVDTGRNKVIKEFISKITNNNHLPLKVIVKLQSEFSKLPVKVINNF
tara:strand:- start:425 stop:2050 length:1626 start_codon:yes stop_codon:yes gene_type:complete